MYRLLKIHKPEVHLSPIVSSIDTWCRMLSGFLQNILSPFACNNNFSVEIQKAPKAAVYNFQLYDSYIMLRFDVVSPLLIFQ